MSDDDSDARTGDAPPLTVTASTPIAERKSFDDGGESSREHSRSRISDHVELPRPQNDDNNRDRRRGAGAARRPGGGPPRRSQGPQMKWHKNYAAIDPRSGRVLFIDFAKKDNKGSHIRKVAAQEIFSLDGLRRAYRSQGPENQPAMRVIHVQNADWAIPFLLRKFDIDINNDDTIGADFGRYIRYRKPELRGGKPFLNGKTWKVRYDPWRGVNKTSFGVDYAKSFKTISTMNRGSANPADRIMQLNDFDENDEPFCAHDVYVQRLSCYVQHKQTSDKISLDDLPMRKHFYPVNLDEEVPIVNGDLKDKAEYKSRLRHLDNGNVIIIFDNSSSGSFEDTLIAARREWECRWRRLPFYLAFEAREAIEDDDDENLALQSSKAILSDIFKAVVTAWDDFLDHAVTHMSILEDKIYDQPADESRAPELWSNSSAWLKMEKLLNVHISVMHEMKVRLHELTDDIDTEDNWLEDCPGDFERLNNLIAEDLTKPTESLISLLYQSVAIRDSRHSLELGLSMWRLSWITFIFLPLTFIVGFFGMSVDTFVDHPSIKWYFIAAIPFMIGIVAFYFMMKRLASINRRTPYERTVYQNFFQEMAATSPALWSRGGPREYVRPKGRIARMKWNLIRFWLQPGKTIRLDVADEVGDGRATGRDGLGVVSQIQRWLSRRWTRQISRSLNLDTELGLMDDFIDDRMSTGEHSIGEGLTDVAEVLGAPAAPAAAAAAAARGEHDPTRLTVPGTLAKAHDNGAVGAADPPQHHYPVVTAAAALQQRPRARSTSDSSSRRPRSSGSGGRNSNVLVEEEDVEWLNERGREGKDWLWRKSMDSDHRRKSSSGSRSRSRD